MRILNSLALCATLLAPLAALSTDLTVGIEGQVEYDDNAFRQGGDEDDDVLFRLRPSVKIHEDRGEDLRYALSYAVPFEFAVDHGDELDDIDHVAWGTARYRVNERMDLFASDSFRYMRSALQEVRVDDVLAGDGTFLINDQRDRVTLNDAELGLTYRFSPRLAGNLRATHEYFDSEREDRAENWLLSGIGDLSYVLTPRHTVGLGVRALHQEFEDRSNIPGSQVQSYNAFAQWIWSLDETLTFQVAAGPTVIHSEQDDPDATLTSVAIPFLNATPGSLPNGLLDPDTGLPAAQSPIPAGSIIVSQLATCPQIPSISQPAFPEDEGLCPINPSNPGILLLAGDPRIAAAQTPVTLSDANAEGEDDTRLDFFAEAVLRKDWTETLHSALRYSRTQGGASGIGGAVIRDTVSLANTWDFAEKWQVALRGEWNQRKSVVDDGVSQRALAGDPGGFAVAPAGTLAPGGLVTVRGGSGNQIDTMRWGVAGRLTHRFTRNTSSFVQLTYNEQTSDRGTLGDPTDFDNFLAVIGVRHEFDPIKLW